MGPVDSTADVSPPDVHASPGSDAGAAAMRLRILDATRYVLAHFGTRKLSLSEVAMRAKVSRPTLYKYFQSKEVLLDALAEHENVAFEAGVAEAISDHTGPDRLDAALVFVVRFQGPGPGRAMLARNEPEFVRRRMAEALPVMIELLVPIITESYGPIAAAADDRVTAVASMIARVAMSHFLFPTADGDAPLREMRLAASLMAV